MPIPLRMTPLVAKILVGASRGGLDVAGSALVDGAWPILKGALNPVLDRLEKQLGGPVTRSPDIAHQAIEAFDQDPNLQARLRQGLLDALEPVLRDGTQVTADVQRLILIAAGNQRALDEVVSRMDEVGDAVRALQQDVDAGVNLSPRSLEAINTIVQQQIANALDARRLADEAAAIQPAVTGASVDADFTELNRRALALLGQGEARRALADLHGGLTRLGPLVAEAPTDTRLILHLGYLYKTAAQAEFQLGDDTAGTVDLGNAERAFMLAINDVPPDQQTLADMAGGLNGMGNILYERGEYRRAIEQYKQATSLAPSYAYAWHDLFLAYVALARAGEVVDRAEMRHALAQVKLNRSGYPDFDDTYLAQLDALLQGLGQ